LPYIGGERFAKCPRRQARVMLRAEKAMRMAVGVMKACARAGKTGERINTRQRRAGVTFRYVESRGQRYVNDSALLPL